MTKFKIGDIVANVNDSSFKAVIVEFNADDNTYLATECNSNGKMTGGSFDIFADSEAKADDEDRDYEAVCDFKVFKAA